MRITFHQIPLHFLVGFGFGSALITLWGEWFAFAMFVLATLAAVALIVGLDEVRVGKYVHAQGANSRWQWEVKLGGQLEDQQPPESR